MRLRVNEIVREKDIMLAGRFEVMQQVVQLCHPDAACVLTLSRKEQHFVGHVPLFFPVGPRRLRADVLGHTVSQVWNLFVLLDGPELLLEFIHRHLWDFFRFTSRGAYN